MAYDDKDLERILEVAKTVSMGAGFEPDNFELVYRAAVAMVQKEKAADVANLYGNLGLNAFLVRSFQMGVIKFGTHSKIIPCAVGWSDPIREIINHEFDTDLSERKRGDCNVYVWLGLDTQGNGLIQSYGNAHSDGVHRINMHYFAAVGNYDKLLGVVDSFRSDPSNMSTFVKSAFGWKNEVPRHMGGQPDLYTRMERLYLKVGTNNVESIQIKR